MKNLTSLIFRTISFCLLILVSKLTKFNHHLIYQYNAYLKNTQRLILCKEILYKSLNLDLSGSFQIYSQHINFP